jgi:hypothetical protein
MEKNKKEIKEPYPPERTPQPPQTMNPASAQEKNEKKNEQPENQLRANPGTQPDKESKPKENGKLLSDDADIHDETTI